VSPATDPIGHGRQAPPDAGDRQDPEVRLRASLRLLTEDEGGPSKPIASECGLLARFGSDDQAPMWGVQIAFDSPGARRSGEAADVHLSAWADEDFDAPPGTALRVYQGSQLIGVGTIH
jgi:hypothetical protein